MLGFARTDNEALVSCLGDPQRAGAAHHELLRRAKDALDAVRAGLHDENPAVREGCCSLLDHLVDTDSMGELRASARGACQLGFVPALPLTETGKIRKAGLGERGVTATAGPR
ncbi:hypothetical protein [Streptomyces sp. NPDC055134]